MNIKAFAKVNLFLSVLGKRGDGFHELLSLMQTINLCDEICISKDRDSGIKLFCDQPVTTDYRDNLVYGAADLFFQQTGIVSGVTLSLKKRIPQAAGMGGGSSDAAAVLVGLNRMHNNLLSIEDLRCLGAELGSDVPFFITGGTAIVRGRGEIVENKPFLGKLLILLINPGFSVPTGYVFSSLNLDLTSKRPLHNIPPALETGSVSVSKLKKYVHNDLEPIVLKLFPEVGEPLQWLRDNGAVTASVSGSGGTVFGVYSDFDSASRAMKAAKPKFPWVYLAETVDSKPMQS